ncbi:MAG: hypothetical protein HYZ42_13740, partial [Bacteroidetes bacterium]|nr:hypothetical protein [Bacteroidota bacterium]
MPQNASISYKKLRQTIGWLGISLPLLVYLDTIIVTDCQHLQDSISHYYYTSANSLFVGIFWGLGLVLFFYPAYKDEPSRDAMLTNFAGICAICVSLFPTNSNSHDSCALFCWPISSVRAGIHYTSAALMLCIFSYMSIRIFTKTDPGNDLSLEKNKWKRRRNLIYIIAGWLTLASIATIGIITIIENKNPDFKITTKYTYWLEVAALLPFGIAWIIKGGFVLTDDDEISTLGKVKNL